MARWSLANIEDRHHEHPATFTIPARAERISLAPGDCAKLVFLSDGSGERMWVRVQRRDSDGYYVGVLENIPTVTNGVALGDQIAFGAEHVADVERRADA